MIQFDISSIPRTLEQVKPRSLELVVKKVKISILEQVEKSGKEVDTNLQKWLKRCLLLSHFLLEEKEDFEIVLKELREEEVKVIEKEQLYFDLLLLQSELSMPVTQEGLNKLEYDQLVGAYGKWQLLLLNLLKIKYEAQIANLEKSNWLITPTKYLILLELLIDRIYRFPVKTIFLKAIELKINQVNKDLHRFWEERSFDWSSVNRQLIPVKVVVWDTGVDSSCIKYCSSNLSLSYDKNCKLTEEPLMSIDTVTENEWELFKGFLDFKFAKRSIAANYFFKELAQYDEKDMARFKTIANQLIVYCHGTSVASVVSQGNPCIEIIPIRVTFDANHVSSTLTLYTEAWIKNSLKMHNAVFNWLRQHKIPIINISWLHRIQDIDTSLKNTGMVNDKERAILTESLFAALKKNLYEGIKNCPNTLFVIGAGNSNGDLEEEAFIPSSFDLPNLITVGAVNHVGKRTGFTSIGKKVQIYANGSYVNVTIPTGYNIQSSGTSIAAPQVANLAAMMLSIRPNMSITLLKKYILEYADHMPEEEIFVLNPKKTIEHVLAMIK